MQNNEESIVSMKRSVNSKLCCNKFVLEADIESSLWYKTKLSGTGCAIFFYYFRIVKPKHPILAFPTGNTDFFKILNVINNR
jgi:hypothetical protein